MPERRRHRHRHTGRRVVTLAALDNPAVPASVADMISTTDTREFVPYGRDYMCAHPGTTVQQQRKRKQTPLVTALRDFCITQTNKVSCGIHNQKIKQSSSGYSPCLMSAEHKQLCCFFSPFCLESFKMFQIEMNCIFVCV